jgi:hypothetical protein
MAAKKTTSKSDFIRSQPANLSAAEVVAKAKGAGLKFSRQLVSAVRARAKAKGKGKAPAVKQTRTVKSGAPATKTTNKAAFVRAHGNLSPKEIIAKAKAEGIKLGVSYVYNVRGADKMAAKKRGAKRSAPAVASPALVKHAASSNVESLLRAVGAELGLAHAIAVLHEERARVRAAIGG